MAALDLSEIVRTGDRRKSLEAIRDHLASQLTDAEGREVAAISKELRSTIAELYSLPGGSEVSPSDEIAERRARRRAAAESP